MRYVWPKIDISIIIYLSKPYLKGLMDSLEKIDYPKDRYTIYILNNDTPDNSYKYLEKKYYGNPQYRFIDNRGNIGFCGGHNVTMGIGDGDYIFLLNPDGEIEADTLKKMVKYLESDKKIGVADCTQKPYNHPKLYNKETGEVTWCSGGAMLIRKKALKDTGLFDFKFFMYADDVDLSWRMWSKGWKCVFIPEASIVHYVLDKSKHKKGQVSLNEHYHSIRNYLYMRMIYSGPIQHFYHSLVVFRLVRFKKVLHIIYLSVMQTLYKLGQFFFLFLKRIFVPLQSAKSKVIYKVKKNIFLPLISDPDYLILKALKYQIKEYPHIFWRWILQSRNKKSKYIKFYGIGIYEERND